jgi:hypothetical protein
LLSPSDPSSIFRVSIRDFKGLFGISGGSSDAMDADLELDIEIESDSA